MSNSSVTLATVNNSPWDQFPLGSIPPGINPPWDQSPLGSSPGAAKRGSLFMIQNACSKGLKAYVSSHNWD